MKWPWLGPAVALQQHQLVLLEDHAAGQHLVEGRPQRGPQLQPQRPSRTRRRGHPGVACRGAGRTRPSEGSGRRGPHTTYIGSFERGISSTAVRGATGQPSGAVQQGVGPRDMLHPPRRLAVPDERRLRRPTSRVRGRRPGCPARAARCGFVCRSVVGQAVTDAGHDASAPRRAVTIRHDAAARAWGWTSPTEACGVTCRPPVPTLRVRRAAARRVWCARSSAVGSRTGVPWSSSAAPTRPRWRPTGSPRSPRPALPCPRCSRPSSGQVLVLERIGDPDTPPDWAGLGRAVARLHRTVAATAGTADNSGGRIVQVNGWCDELADVLRRASRPGAPRRPRRRAGSAGAWSAPAPDRCRPCCPRTSRRG